MRESEISHSEEKRNISEEAKTNKETYKRFAGREIAEEAEKREKEGTPEGIYTKAIAEGGYVLDFARDLHMVGAKQSEGKEKEIFTRTEKKIQRLEEAAETLKTEEMSGYYLNSVYAHLERLYGDLDLAMEIFNSDEMKEEIIEIKNKRLEISERFIESDIKDEDFMAANTRVSDWGKIKEELIIKETKLGSEEQTEELERLKEETEEKYSRIEKAEK